MSEFYSNLTLSLLKSTHTHSVDTVVSHTAVDTDQRGGAGAVDAGPRRRGVGVGEEPVDLAQRHASPAVAHLDRAAREDDVTGWNSRKEHRSRKSVAAWRPSRTFTVRSSFPSATCAWMGG